MTKTTSPSAALGFEETATGYRATDAQVAWWESRDTCPACATVCEPYASGRSAGHNVNHYQHECPDGESVSWMRGA